MCLIAFAVRARPGLPLLLAANRDEFFERPTAPLHRWALPGGQEVLGGRDLRDSGTWLGVSLAGRVAMLTNVRGGPAGQGLRSRGELATRWLSGLRLETLLAELDPQTYGGFNLVIGDLHTGTWHWLSNCDPQCPNKGVVPQLTSRSLAPGVYGLSNAALDTPPALRSCRAGKVAWPVRWLTKPWHPPSSYQPPVSVWRTSWVCPAPLCGCPSMGMAHAAAWCWGYLRPNSPRDGSSTPMNGRTHHRCLIRPTIGTIPGAAANPCCWGSDRLVTQAMARLNRQRRMNISRCAMPASSKGSPRCAKPSRR
jgi:hypothetical protein